MNYGIAVTSHGNYVCPFCPKRKVMKTTNGIYGHVEKEHLTESKIWLAEDAKKRALQRAETAESNLAEYKKLQDQKPRQKYYDAVVFCTTCQQLASCGMPMGASPDRVTCPNCGVCALYLVSNVAYWTAK